MVHQARVGWVGSLHPPMPRRLACHLTGKVRNLQRHPEGEVSRRLQLELCLGVPTREGVVALDHLQALPPGNATAIKPFLSPY
eukprot:652028-Prorocentrum_minimum.AAC.1